MQMLVIIHYMIQYMPLSDLRQLTYDCLQGKPLLPIVNGRNELVEWAAIVRTTNRREPDDNWKKPYTHWLCLQGGGVIPEIGRS
jgi:hypothetical protein